MNRVFNKVAKRTLEQKKATEPKDNVWVSASAGSGKTSVLVDRMLRLLIYGTPPSHLLCLTFTRAAATEMSKRLVDELSGLVKASDTVLTRIMKRYGKTNVISADLGDARRLFAKVLETTGGMRIQTIHSFCDSLLRRFPLEAGIAPNFHVLEDREVGELLLETRDKVFAELEKRPDLDEALSEVINIVGETKFNTLIRSLIDKKSKLQRSWHHYGGFKEAIDATFDYLEVQPCEKEENTIIDACLNENFDRVKLTYLANEMRNGSKTDAKRAENILQWISEEDKRFDLWPKYVKNYLKEDGSKLNTLVTKTLISHIPKIDQELSLEADRVFSVVQRCKRIQCARLTRSLLLLVREILSCYEKEKRLRNRLDYDDLILFSSLLLRRPEVSSWVLFKLDSNIDHILVDEAQDTSPDQWEVIYSLASEFFSGQSARNLTRTLFVVGDEKQSIYRFQGAGPQIFKTMRKRFKVLVQAGDKPWKVLPLSRSFRNVPVLLQFIDKAFDILKKENGVLISDEWRNHEPHRIGHAGQVEVWPLEITKSVERKPWDLPIYQHHAVTAEASLAKRIALCIKDWITSKEILQSKNRPIEPGDILILVRTRSRIFEEMVLALKKQEISVAGADRVTLTEQLVVQDLIAIAEFILLPQDDLMLANVLKGPLIGFDDAKLFDLATEREEESLWSCLRRQSKKRPDFRSAYKKLSRLISELDDATPFKFFSNLITSGGRQAFVGRLGSESNDLIDEFLNRALMYESSHVPSLQGFVYWLNVTGGKMQRDLEHASDQVRVMTVHGAKGLEAPIVFLPDTVDLSQDKTHLFWTTDDDSALLLCPIGRGSNDAVMGTSAHAYSEHERIREYYRLLYVAMTRAQDRLYICGYRGKRKVLENSWYSITSKTMQAFGSKTESTEIVVGGDKIKVKRLSKPQTVAVEARDTGIYLPVEQPTPIWLSSTVASQKSSRKVINPSILSEEGHLLFAPISSDSDQLLRGKSIHKLLEMLPEVAIEHRSGAAKRFLFQLNHPFSEELANDIVKEATSIIEDKRFEAFFGSNSLGEVPLVGLVDEQLISGRVDRLVVTDNEILVVDYKTDNVFHPARPVILKKYIRQMGLYKEILAKIYSKKPVRCFILWTNIPAIEEISSIGLDRVT